jgi:hypothetical protein
MKAIRALIVVLAVASAFAVVSAAAKKEKKPLADQFTAQLVSVNAATAGGLGDQVTIWIDAYTSDDDAASLRKVVMEGGQDTLISALSNQRAGRIRIGDSMTYPLCVARERKGSDGRVVWLATNNPLAGVPLTQGLRAEDYRIGFIELKLKNDGTGEGTLIGMAQIGIDENNNLSVASLGTQPNRLINVQTAAKK